MAHISEVAWITKPYPDHMISCQLKKLKLQNSDLNSGLSYVIVSPKLFHPYPNARK